MECIVHFVYRVLYAALYDHSTNDEGMNEKRNQMNIYIRTYITNIGEEKEYHRKLKIKINEKARAKMRQKKIVNANAFGTLYDINLDANRQNEK